MCAAGCARDEIANRIALSRFLLHPQICQDCSSQVVLVHVGKGPESSCWLGKIPVIICWLGKGPWMTDGVGKGPGDEHILQILGRSKAHRYCFVTAAAAQPTDQIRPESIVGDAKQLPWHNALPSPPSPPRCEATVCPGLDFHPLRGQRGSADRRDQE